MSPRIKDIFSLFTLPFIVILLATIPGINAFAFSGHYGLGWFVLPFCTPYVLLQFGMLMLHEESVRRYHLKAGALAIVSYLIVLYPLSGLIVNIMYSTFGLEIKQTEFFKLISFPFGFAIPPYGEENQRAIERALWFFYWF